MKSTGIDAWTVIKILAGIAILWIGLQVVFFVFNLIGELLKILVLAGVLFVIVLLAHRLLRGGN